MNNRHVSSMQAGMYRVVSAFMILSMLMGAFAIPVEIVQAAGVLRQSALVLVNAQSADYADFQHFIQPYLDHFGIPYTTLDVSTTPVTADVEEFALLVIGHRNIDSGATQYLDSAEEGFISAAVNAGSGLVNFDNALSADGSNPRYQFLDDVFTFGYNNTTSGSDVTFADPTLNYIIQNHTLNQTITTGTMSLAGITLPGTVTSLASSGSQPFVAVTNYGSGRAVQFGSYDWISHSVKGPLWGLDDLFWRSMVWAARKPFVMQGLPSFVTMRMDDVSGPLWWIDAANDYGFIPWAGVFTNDIDSTEAAELSSLVTGGKATSTIHAFENGTNRFFYYDHNNSQNYDDAVVASNFAEATQWFADRDIQIGEYATPHYYEVGSNVFEELDAWGIKYISTVMDPGQNESNAQWMMAGPFRLYETGAAYERNQNIYYADYMPTQPGSFNCITEIRDITGYEWLGNGRTGVETAIEDGTEWLKRPLDSMAIADLFSHEYTFIGSMNETEWRQVMQGITQNIASYTPIYVSRDYACAYARAIHDSNISGGIYNPTTESILVDLNGITDMPTKFYVFREDGGQIIQQLVDVQTFNGTTQVNYNIPGPLDHVTVSPDPADVIAGTTQYFTAAGYDVENNPISGLSFTWSVVNGGGTISSNGLFTAGATTGTYANTVQATSGAFSGTATISVTATMLDHFAFDTITSPQHSSAPFTVTILARDAANNPVATYNDTATLSVSAGVVTPTSVSFVNGVWTGEVTIPAMNNGISLTVQDGTATGTSNAFNVLGPPPDEGPGGPILVVTSNADRFGRYYAEILRVEGLNEFNVTDIGNVNVTMLAGYDVVILAHMALDDTQASLFTDWVTAGGNLIAMRPDARLVSLLGLTSEGTSLADAYLLVNTTSGPGVGIVDQTIQYHSSADRYTLNGATVVATLYSDAATETPNPAVTIVNVGSNGGQAAAFTFDLARSIVYTRQGNPDWIDINGDGSDGPVRADDLFHNGADPDWVDLTKVAIPQADEQQRLLVNMIQSMNLDNKPLPRFWYFPRDEKAVVLLTSDDHSSSNLPGRLDQYISLSPAGCSVEDWECIRSSMYIYSGSTLTEGQAFAYTADGFEIGVHVDTGCSNYTLSGLQTLYTNQLNAFETRFPSLPLQASERTHCIAWSGWAMQADVKEQTGIRLDTNYYFWPPEWVDNQPGLFTGSGLPMRFAGLDGSMFDVYQATTQMTDESGQSYPYTIDTLLNRALGADGYYGVFTANMHSDSLNSSGANAIIASAQSQGVPIVSGRQLVNWLDGRNNSFFSAISQQNDILSFHVTAAPGSNGLRAMLPVQGTNGPLTGITHDGSSVTYVTQTIKGVQYAFFDAITGDYEASYVPDTIDPIISGVTATFNPDGTVTITWTTDEPSASRVDFGLSADALTLNATDGALVTSHSLTLNGLLPLTTYHYRVNSTDASNNTALSPEPPAVPLTFTTPVIPPGDDTVADFNAGTLSCGYVSATSDGELILPPTIGAEFDGSTLRPGWEGVPWGSGGTMTVSDGKLNLNYGTVRTSAFYTPGRVLEFQATFSNQTTSQSQHAGFAIDFNTSLWAAFSTRHPGGTDLFARSVIGGSSIETNLGGSYVGSSHLYRIEWYSDHVLFFIDGTQVASHAIAISSNMRPVASDGEDVSVLTIDWMRMSPFTGPCTFTSRVFDAGSTVTWQSLSWTAGLPVGASLAFNYRVGDTSTPDGTWSPFIDVPTSGAPISGSARYAQYQVTLNTANASVTPEVQEVLFTNSTELDTTAPTITNRLPAVDATDVAIDSNGTVTFSEMLASATVDGTTVYLRKVGDATNIPATVVLAGNIVTLDPSSSLAKGTTYTITVKSGITDLAGNPMGADADWNFTTIPDSATDTTVVDFSAGTLNACVVDATDGDGAVRLPASVEEGFSSTSLPAGWSTQPWTGGTATFSGGNASVDGAKLRNDTLFGPGTSVEFLAIFANEAFQHIGLGGGNDTFNEPPIVMFSTRSSVNTIYTSIWLGGSFLDVPIPNSSNYLGTPHLYRIDWKTNGIDFYIDDALVDSRTEPVNTQMRVALSDYNMGGSSLLVDQVLVLPYRSPCMFESRVHDAGQLADWLALSWEGASPMGTNAGFETRSGNTSTPDANWSAWAGVNSPVASPNGRYIQYRALLTSTVPEKTPVLESVALTYALAPNTAPVVVDDAYTVPENGTLTVDAPGVLGNDTDAENNPLTALKLSDPSSGMLTFNSDGSFVYTPAVNFHGAVSFTYQANDGVVNGDIATVAITVEPNNYRLSVMVVGNGSVTKDPNQAYYHSGDAVQLTASPDAGWSFSDWSVDVSGPDNPVSITISGDTNITATFTETPPVCTGILFVDKDSIAANPNGCSWGWAFRTLQDALAVAPANGTTIWVAEGTYYPDEGAGQSNNNRASSFWLEDGVSIYGGFAGTETLLSQRTLNTNITTLSGDIDQVTDNAGNAYHVVTSLVVSPSALLDGFTITGGYANQDGLGGGIYNENASPTLSNLIISANASSNFGGGMYSVTSSSTDSSITSPQLTKVIFTGNKSERGGGLVTMSSNAILTDVVFTNNLATDGAGGGMNSQTVSTNDPASAPVLTNVTFSGNTGKGGGGLFNGNSNAILTNVTFSGNTAILRGGAILNEGASPILNHVTFGGNIAPAGTGAIRNVIGGGTAAKQSNPVIRNSILWGNDAGGGVDEITSDNAGFTTIINSVVENGCQPLSSACTNVVMGDPLLGTLSNNGGFTETMALGMNSSAIDAGDNFTCAAVDQRGTARPQGPKCDAGAYEAASLTTLILFPVTGEYNSTITLTATLEYNGTGIDGKTISFTLNGSSVGTATTDINGIAALNTVSLAGIDPATYANGITASFAGDPTYSGSNASADLIVTKATPVITWVDPADIFQGTPLSTTQLNATASVPGTFVYNPAAGTVLNTGNGQTLSVNFTPDDSLNYNNASANVLIDVYACYALTLGHAGQGTDPGADPVQSTGCPAGTYRAGEAIQLSGATPDTGWHIASWTGTGNDLNTASTNSLTMPANDHTASVNYAQNEYTLDIISDYGSVTKSPSQPTYHHGDIVTLSVTPNAGWTFVDWTPFLTDNKVTITGDTTVTANYIAQTLTLTYTAGDGGTLSGNASQTVNYGESGSAVTAVPNTGYHFVTWSDGVLTAARTDMNVTANVSVTANFAIDTFTLNYTAGPGGTVTGTLSQTVNYGEDGTSVTALANTGYHFTSWSDGLLTATRTDENVITDLSVKANFAIDTFTLNYTAGAGGTLTGSVSQTVNYGGDGTPVTALADPSYHFVRWSDGSTINPRTDAGVTGVVNVSAEFALDAITHSITLVPGWNLVSFNVRPVNTSLASVLSSITGQYDLVYAWDATGAHAASGNWLKADNIPYSPDSLTTLDETMGFWIHMTGAATLDVLGTVPTTTSITLNTGAGGWNLVSYPSSVNGSLPGAVSDHGVGTNYSLLYAYHAAETVDPWKLFDRTTPPFANDLLELTPGWGYWVKVSANSSWSVDYAAP